ncbi:MAG: membrane protein [Phycisphaerae bacterium]|nr:MAG: membrane protein [Phycisphaerae bacterium]
MKAPTTTPAPLNRTKTTQLVIVFLIAILVRAGVATSTVRKHEHAAPDKVGTLHFDDEQWYWSIGQSYRAGDGMVGEFGHRAERMPLYPWVLSWFSPSESGVSAARWFQYFFGALAACAVMALAWKISTYGIVAGLIVAFDPTLVGSASLLLSETVAVTFLAGLWWVAWPLRQSRVSSPLRWLAAILLSILVIYAKESTLILVAALLGYIVFARRDRTGIIGAAASVACIIIALLPWAYRNKQATGDWIWLTSRGGISLYDGVHPGATGASDLGNIKSAPEVANFSEAEWNRHFKAEAWKHILDDPIRILRLSWVKFARTWSPILNAADYQSWKIRIIFAGWYIPLYAFVILGVYTHRSRFSLLIALLIPTICVSATHVFFVGSVRYRLVAIPTLAILAAMGLQAVMGMRKLQVAPDVPKNADTPESSV